MSSWSIISKISKHLKNEKYLASQSRTCTWETLLTFSKMNKVFCRFTAQNPRCNTITKVFPLWLAGLLFFLIRPVDPFSFTSDWRWHPFSKWSLRACWKQKEKKTIIIRKILLGRLSFATHSRSQRMRQNLLLWNYVENWCCQNAIWRHVSARFGTFWHVSTPCSYVDAQADHVRNGKANGLWSGFSHYSYF